MELKPSNSFDKRILNNYLDKVRIDKKRFDMYLPLKESERKQISEYFKRMETYTSNHIEGNSYTLKQTNFLIETKTTPSGVKVKDTIEILNLYKSLEYLENCNEDITEDLIKHIHRIITAGTLDDVLDEGEYKRQRNWIGNIETSAPSHVPIHMNKLLDWYYSEKDNINPIVLASKFKYRFLKIHPFIDGNGRTSRWLFNYIMKNNGYVSVIIYPEDKEEYYKVLDRCSKDNVTSLIIFMCKCILKQYGKIEEFLN